MSVLVKNMQMPSECEYCGFCRVYPQNGNVWCNASNRLLTAYWRELHWTHLNVERPDWCPLVEIPEKHGRLIDMDELKADYGMKDDCADCDKEERRKSVKCEFDRCYTKMDFCGWLDDATVVIEAEGVDE